MKNLRMAQETAFKKKKNVQVIWRGYTEEVDHNGPAFTTADLRGRLVLALRHILKMHKMKHFRGDEEQVY